jgi:DNA-directed RNA polymerase specialized sigma24 family protein
MGRELIAGCEGRRGGAPRLREILVRFFANKAGGQRERLAEETFARWWATPDALDAAIDARLGVLRVAVDVLREHRATTRELDTAGEVVGLLRHAVASEAAAELPWLLESLRKVPLELQIVAELYYFEQLTTTELAFVLDAPEDVARARLVRAMQHLRDRA